MKNPFYLWGVIALIGSAAIFSLVFGELYPVFPTLGEGFSSESGLPGILDYIRAVSGMVLAGLAFTLTGGCAGRNLVLIGQGNSDSAVFILGMLFGSAFLYNFGLSSQPVCGTVPEMPFIMFPIILGGIIFCISIGFIFLRRGLGK
jgi:hypothetical protein